MSLTNYRFCYEYEESNTTTSRGADEVFFVHLSDTGHQPGGEQLCRHLLPNLDSSAITTHHTETTILPFNTTRGDLEG